MPTSPTSELTQKHLAGLRSLKKWCDEHAGDLEARGIDPRQLQRDYIRTGALPADYAPESSGDAGKPSPDSAKYFDNLRKAEQFAEKIERLERRLGRLGRPPARRRAADYFGRPGGRSPRRSTVHTHDRA